MEARQIKVGEDYELRVGHWGRRIRVRILEKQGYGFWRARNIRDKYSRGVPKQEVRVESRNLVRPWSETRAELEARDLVEQQYQKARAEAESQAELLIEALSQFKVELRWTEVDTDQHGLPTGSVMSLDIPTEELQRIVDSLEKAEIEPRATHSSALAELL